jgi:hypothetical protein
MLSASNMKVCDFCADDVPTDDPMAMIYPAYDFAAEAPLSYKSSGSWLACATCAAFIRQFDLGELRAKDNLAHRCLEKLRRKYGLRGLPGSQGTTQILFSEIRTLHEAFWMYRNGEPVPYMVKEQEG